MTKKSIGLYICGDVIHYVRVEKKFASLSITGNGVSELALISKIINNASVASGIEATQTIIKYAELPGTSRDKYTNLVNFEIKKNFPALGKSKIVYDHYTAEKTADGKRSVFYAVATQKNIDNTLSLLEGINPDYLGCEHLALLHSYFYLKQKTGDVRKNVAILYIHERFTTIIILENKKLVYAGTVSSGGMNLNNINSFVDEFSLSFQKIFYNKTPGFIQPDAIYIASDTPEKISDVSKHFSERFKCSVSIFSTGNVHPVALGYALLPFYKKYISLNFIKSRSREKNSQSLNVLYNLKTTAALLIICAGVFIYTNLSRSRELGNKHKALENKISVLKKSITDINTTRNNLDTTETRLKTFKLISRNKRNIPGIFSALSGSLPRGTILDELSISENDVLYIRGSTSRPFGVTDLLKNLNKTGIFKTGELESMEKKENKTTFKIKISLNNKKRSP